MSSSVAHHKAINYCNLLFPEKVSPSQLYLYSRVCQSSFTEITGTYCNTVWASPAWVRAVMGRFSSNRVI